MNMKLPSTFSIFPVSGKRPLVEWGEYSKRLPTPQEFGDWGLKHPGCSWGIATGPISKVLVLDDDGGLDLEKYPVPKTWTVKTPRGGNHYYLRWSEELSKKVTTKVGVLPKVDTRGEGGFVVFYGFSSPYFTTPLAQAPKWLVDLLPNKNNHSQIANKYSETTNKSQLQELLDGISNGNRNDSFTRIAGGLRARGYSSNDMYLLLEPKARELDFSLQELRLLTESVARYKPNERQTETPIRIETKEDKASCIEEFLKDQEKVDWIVPGLIAKKSVGFIVGLPETNKTWMMIDLAIEVAKGGGLWLGKYPVEKAKVLFIDQERFKGETQRRFRSVLAAKSLTSSELQSSLFVRCGTTTRLNLQPSFDAFKREVSELRPGLIIIDSFTTFHTTEENNRQSIQAVLERIKEIRNEFGCTFLFIHHENKMAFDKENNDPSISQMAGSIAIPAAAESVFTVRKIEDGSMVYHTKSTLAPTIDPFMVKVVDLNETKTKIKIEAY